MPNFTIEENGIFFIKEFIRKIKISLFVIVPILFLVGIIVLYINALPVAGRERHYLPGAIIGTILITKMFIIRGIQLLSIIRNTITEITLIDDKVIFLCARGLRGKEYNFETSLDNIIITEELNPKKIFKDEKIFTIKFDENKKLYFVPSFWDNQDEIIQLLKPRNE